MPSLKDLRNRIASVKATQKITKAMQMVAAAKLRRAQSAAEDSRSYARCMDVVLDNLRTSLGENTDGLPPLMIGTGKDQVHLLIVATAERGLCGGFNASIARLARDHVRKLLADGKEVNILCIGRKGVDVLKMEFGSRIIDQIDLREVKNIEYAIADKIGQTILKKFAEGTFDVATLFYSEFKSVISQIPVAQQIIPPQIKKDNQSDHHADAHSGARLNAHFYEYEPEEGEILQDLLPRNVCVQIFRALLENAASEQGARMSAMDNATRNAGEMIDKLTISYNRQRQAQITKELIEIISGAEAL